MATTISELVRENAQLRDRHAGEFKAIFKWPIEGFFHPFYGFDIVRFDERVIRPPDGTSTEEHVRANYGDRAVALIKLLIKAEV